MSPTELSLLPLLTHIQANLGEDLSLTALAARSSRSSTYLQRTFKAQMGESPKQYVARLRLERAALGMLIFDSTVLEIALDCGFANHETFTRAFRRRFGVAPHTYRKHATTQSRRRTTRTEQPPDVYSISATKIKRLRPAHLAFIRHVGAYESVPDILFDRLNEWATRQGIAGPRIWMGLGHDAPGITATEHLRFDAALVVPSIFSPTNDIGYQPFEGGDFAVTTHVGSYETLSSAYSSIVPRVMGNRTYQFVGLPAVEIYHSSRVNASFQLNTTELCLPVRNLTPLHQTPS